MVFWNKQQVNIPLSLSYQNGKAFPGTMATAGGYVTERVGGAQASTEGAQLPAKPPGDRFSAPRVGWQFFPGLIS